MQLYIESCTVSSSARVVWPGSVRGQACGVHEHPRLADDAACRVGTGQVPGDSPGVAASV
jgi:hypothetical protein